MSRQIKAAAFAAVLALAVVGSMAQVTIQRGWSLGMFADGSAAAPSISFATATDKGIYNGGAGNLDFGVNGTGQFRVSSGTSTLQLKSGGQFSWLSGALGTGASTTLSEAAAGKLTLTGTTPMFQLGGTSSSFPAFKQNGASIDLRFADDSGYAVLTAAKFNIAGSGSGNVVSIGSVPLIQSVAPTISSGFGTSPSIVNSNGPAAFTLNVGTGGAATSGVIGLPTATTGWSCFANDRTNNTVTRQTATTTTTATFTAAAAWAASDILNISCFAY